MRQLNLTICLLVCCCLAGQSQGVMTNVALLGAAEGNLDMAAGMPY